MTTTFKKKSNKKLKWDEDNQKKLWIVERARVYREKLEELWVKTSMIHVIDKTSYQIVGLIKLNGIDIALFQHFPYD